MNYYFNDASSLLPSRDISCLVAGNSLKQPPNLYGNCPISSSPISTGNHFLPSKYEGFSPSNFSHVSTFRSIFNWDIYKMPHPSSSFHFVECYYPTRFILQLQLWGVSHIAIVSGDKCLMDCTPIAKLRPGVRGIRIRCRVARIWDCTNPMLDNQLISVDFLLVDELGDAIQGTVRPRESQWLRDTIDEGNVYVCIGFIVISAKTKYRACRNPDIISVARGTARFERCSDKIPVTFPLNHFDFVSYDRLPQRATNDEYLSDVIGQLTSMGPIEPVYVKDNPVEQRTLELQNLDGDTISATLWTTIAHQINDVYVHQLMEQDCVIVTIAAIGVATFRGTTSLRSKSATKIYLNLPNSATAAFRLALTTPRGFTLKAAAPTREEQMTNNRKTLSDLLLLSRNTPRAAFFPQKYCSSVALLKIIISLLQDARFTCSATIMDINPFNGWWFPSCPTCNRKVSTADAIHYCGNCSIYIDDTPGFRYMLELVMQDETADCVFMIIGEEAEKIIGQPASVLAVDNDDPFILPRAIKQLKGMSRIFEVGIMQTYGSKNNYSGRLSFKVKRTFQPPIASSNTPTATKKRPHLTECATTLTNEPAVGNQTSKTGTTGYPSKEHSPPSSS